MWSPYKFSGKSEYLPACKRVKHEHSCFKVDSFCVLESKIPFFDFLFIPPWKITNSTCMHLLLGYTSKKSWSPKRVFSEANQFFRLGVCHMVHVTYYITVSLNNFFAFKNTRLGDIVFFKLWDLGKCLSFVTAISGCEFKRYQDFVNFDKFCYLKLTQKTLFLPLRAEELI